MKATDYIGNEAEHICIYGDPGTGKSTLAIGALSAGYKVKYFSIDAGVPKGIYDKENARDFNQKELENLEIFILRDTAKFPVGIQTARKVITGKPFNLCDLHGQIDCKPCKSSGLGFSYVCLNECDLDTVVIFDHLTSLTKSALNTCWDGETFAMAGDDEKKSIPANSTFTTWRQQGWLLDDFLSHVQVAPFNVIVIAQEYMAVFEDKSKSIVPHAGTKEYSSTTGSFFGSVIHCSVGGAPVKHRFGSSSTYKSGVLTKSRGHIKIEDMSEPSIVPFLPKLGSTRFQYGPPETGWAPLSELGNVSAGKDITLNTNQSPEQSPESTKPKETMQQMMARLKSQQKKG